MLIPFIAGICIMSATATIGAVILDGGKDWGVFLCGPAAWIAAAFALCCRGILHWEQFHNRRSLLADVDGNIYAVPPWAADAYRSEKAMKFISQQSENEKVRETARTMLGRTDEWGKYFLVAGKPNIRYAPKSVWKEFEAVPKKEAKAMVSQYESRKSEEE